MNQIVKIGIFSLLTIAAIFIVFSLANNQDVYLSPQGSGGSGIVGSGSPSPSPTPTSSPRVINTCCICERDTSIPTTWGECNDFVNDPKCDVGVIRSINVFSGVLSSCTIPNECVGKKIEYLYTGHANERIGKNLIDRVANICVSCPDVNGVLSGCNTFSNVTEAQRYINNLTLPNGTKLTLWGSQCEIPQNASYGGWCRTSSTMGCTLTYKCEKIGYDNCPQEGFPCIIAPYSPAWYGIKCMKDNQLTTARCCGQGIAIINGTLMVGGRWTTNGCS